LLGGGFITLNEQTSDPNTGSITVNAIHVTVPAVADAVISSASAAITGQLIGSSGGPHLILALLLQVIGGGGGGGSSCTDFFTGGGWIIAPDGAKGNFGVSGGVNPGGHTLGHLEYIDHGTGMNVHSTNTPTCTVTGQTSREITGSARVNGVDGNTYVVDVSDNDPSSADAFGIRVSGPGVPTGSYSTPFTALSGGDIEIHK
jgi:hypothetical protein